MRSYGNKNTDVSGQVANVLSHPSHSFLPHSITLDYLEVQIDVVRCLFSNREEVELKKSISITLILLVSGVHRSIYMHSPSLCHLIR